MDDYKGETVFYSTGYQVDNALINQYYLIGAVLCLTAIGIIFGLPIILRGIYLKRRSQKAIVITNSSLYEFDGFKEIWSTDLTKIEKVESRTTTFGFIQIRLKLKSSPNRIITGNFYQNEVGIISNTIFSNRAKLEYHK